MMLNTFKQIQDYIARRRLEAALVRPVTEPAVCVICRRKPAANLLADFPVCLGCYNGLSSTDPICWECGDPLTEAEITAEETRCAGCREALGDPSTGSEYEEVSADDFGE